MTELNHQGITKALANLHAATTANTDATRRTAQSVYTETPATPAGATPATAPAPSTAGR
jgi:hypothetical protein